MFSNIVGCNWYSGIESIVEVRVVLVMSVNLLLIFFEFGEDFELNFVCLDILRKFIYEFIEEIIECNLKVVVYYEIVYEVI